MSGQLALRGNTAASTATGENAGHLRLFVFALFFIFGGITSLNDVIIPKLQGLFTLTYGEVMLVQSAFFTAYFVISLPAAAIVRRVGYMRTAVICLRMMTAGCLLFVPASSSGLFVTFLAALFVLAAGITIVQVVANPLISMLGAPATAHSRLTFAQAFNSLGTTIFPYVGSILILGSISKVDPSQLTGAALDAFRSQATHVIVRTYLGLAAALVLVAALVWLRRNRLVETPLEDVTYRHALDLLRQRGFGFGAACIFLYVGAEVAIGSVIVSFLMQSNVLAIGAEAAGKLLPIFWGGGEGGAFLLPLSAACVFAGQSTGLRCRRRHHAAVHIGQLDRCGIRLFAARDRIVQLHHVPHDFLPGQRRPARTSRRRLGNHPRRRRRRRDRTVDHGPHRGLGRIEGGASGPGDLLRGHS